MLYKSAFSSAAAVQLRMADVDADTGQGHVPLSCSFRKSFVRAASSTAVREKKPRWQRPLLNTQMFLSDKVLFMMQRSDVCLPKAVTQHTAQGKIAFLAYQRGVHH